MTKGLINFKKKKKPTDGDTSLCGTWKRHKQPANVDEVSEPLKSSPVLRRPGVPALRVPLSEQGRKPGERTKPKELGLCALRGGLWFAGWDGGCGVRHTQCEA